MTNKQRFLNQLAVELPFLAAVVGMVLVFASVVLFMFTDDVRRIVAVSVGLFFMLLAVWFAANPYMVSTRTNSPLREETQRFLELIRKVAAANDAANAEQQLDQLRASMNECVDRLTTPGMNTPVAPDVGAAPPLPTPVAQADSEPQGLS